ncbi:MAG: 50S ribosomal protein L18 [Chitinophagales bacterium]
MAFNSTKTRLRIRRSIRKKISGTADRPRLSVFRSNKAIYAQLVDDIAGTTICAASSKEAGATSGTKVEQAKAVGTLLAERAQSNGIETVLFDRGGYKYHGRVQALADGAREKGLKF